MMKMNELVCDFWLLNFCPVPLPEVFVTTRPEPVSLWRGVDETVSKAIDENKCTFARPTAQLLQSMWK